MDAKELRAAALNIPRSQLRRVEFGGGLVFHLRKPSIAQRSRLLREAGMKGDDVSSLDQSKLQVAVVLELACDSTGAKLFERADEGVLLESEAGGWVDKLSKEALKMLGDEAAETGKASGETASAS